MTTSPPQLLEADLDPFEDGAEEKWTPEQAQAFIDDTFQLGARRLAELSQHGIKEQRDGGFRLPKCHCGYGSDFSQQANLAIMKEAFPWLNLRSDGEIFNGAASSADETLETILTRVPDSEWEDFLEKVDVLTKEWELDSDATQELVTQAEHTWMREDGAPELRKALMQQARDSFQAYCLWHLGERTAWEFCQACEQYPEQAGEADVWMDMEKAVEDTDAALGWALGQVKNRPRLQRTWAGLKRRFYEQNEIGAVVERLLKKNLLASEPAQARYAAMSGEDVYQFFLRLTPDTNWQGDGLPQWTLHKEDYGDREHWICDATAGWPSIGPLSRSISQLSLALDLLMQHSETLALFLQHTPAPKDHPELPLGESEDFDIEREIEKLPHRQVYLKQQLDAKTITHQEAVEFAAREAESVLHIWEKEFPDDKRPREAIAAAWAWWKEPTDANRKAASAAGYAATFAVAAAAAAAAAYAGSAAACSAYAAAAAAGYANNAAYYAAQARINASAPVTESAQPPADNDEDDMLSGLSLDDYVKGSGGLRMDVIYRDRVLELVEPLDVETLSRLLQTDGPQLRLYTWLTYLVLRDRQTLNPVAGFTVDTQGTFDSITSQRNLHLSLSGLLADPKYGKPARRALLRWLHRSWQQAAQEDDQDRMFALVLPLLLVGGEAEVRRLSQVANQAVLRDHQMAIGMALVREKRYRRAAKYLGYAPTDATPKGLWVYYPDYCDLGELFKYSEAAENCLAGETYDQFDYLWERHGSPSVKDSAERLPEAALKHLRTLLVNRRVWFPDAGPNQTGDSVQLTRKILDDYTDAELLDWVVDPSQEDLDDGVFEDIRDAIVEGGRKLLASAGQDQLEEAYRHLVRQQLDVITAKYVDHPTKQGSDRLALLIPWGTVLEAYATMVEREDGSYSAAIADMLLAAHEGAIDNERTGGDLPDWPRHGDDSYYKELAGEPLLELEPTREREDPKQLPLPLKETLAADVDNLRALVERTGNRLGLRPVNTRIVLEAPEAEYGWRLPPCARVNILFDARPEAAAQQREMLGTLSGALTHTLAQAGWPVVPGSGHLREDSSASQVKLCWLVDQKGVWL